MKELVLNTILIYKKTVSPLLSFLFGRGCRFTPTCSDYAYQSIKTFGALKGSRLSVARFLNCHPFSKRPFYDPVPEKAI